MIEVPVCFARKRSMLEEACGGGATERLRVQGLGFRIYGLGFRVWGSGFRV